MKQLCLLFSVAFAIGLNAQVKQSEVTNDHYITVKVLEAETGQPLKGIWVPMVDNSQPLNAKTDSHGVARFHLLGPLPDRIGLSFSPNEFSSCSEAAFATDQILKNGVLAGNTCKRSASKPSPTPEAGQLVVFGRRVRLSQRVRREIP